MTKKQEKWYDKVYVIHSFQIYTSIYRTSLSSGEYIIRRRPLAEFVISFEHLLFHCCPSTNNDTSMYFSGKRKESHMAKDPGYTVGNSTCPPIHHQILRRN